MDDAGIFAARLKSGQLIEKVTKKGKKKFKRILARMDDANIFAAHSKSPVH